MLDENFGTQIRGLFRLISDEKVSFVGEFKIKLNLQCVSDLLPDSKQNKSSFEKSLMEALRSTKYKKIFLFQIFLSPDLGQTGNQKLIKYSNQKIISR